MIITKEILKEKVPKDMIPTKIDSALNLFTNVKTENKSGIILYNTNPETWNCLYPFYEFNQKFMIDNYTFNKENPTYENLIEEYQKIYKDIYEKEKGYTKDVRVKILKEAYTKTFNLDDVTISDELSPVYELKFSKSKNVWSLYYFENYVASKIDNLDTLLNQKLYEQKIVPLDFNKKEIDNIELGSNIPYTLSIKKDVEKLENNLIEINT